MNQHEHHHQTPAQREAPSSAHARMEHVPESPEMATEEHAAHVDHLSMVADFRRRFWISLVLTFPILALSPVVQGFLGFGDSLRFAGDSYILFALSSAVFFYGGYPFLKGIVDELRKLAPGMMTLIALAIGVSYVYSSAVVFGLAGEVFFWELATLIDVMLLGHWLEMRSVMAASSALEELAKLMPSAAHKVLPNGTMQDVPLAELVVSDKVLVKPGEKVPADGKVVSGETSMNESMLTGESTPVAKQSGSPVIGGSINGEGSITVEVQRTGKDSYLSQMTALVKQAQGSKSRTQNLADRAALGLVIIAIVAGTATLLVWLLVAGQEFVFALARMVTVMVIACPHALGLAIPLVVAVSTTLSARNGLLIKNRDGFERARNIQAMIFDKTGTLTLGKFGVTDAVTFDRWSKEDLLKYAAAVEAYSEHPIAAAIAASTPQRPAAQIFTSLPGRGAKALVDGKEVLVVSPGYLREKNISLKDDERIAGLAAQGKTVVFVLIDGKLGGAIALADIIRPESREAVAQLKQMGIRSIMVTGDNPQVAKWVAGEIGLDEYFAEVLPGKKVEKVREIQSRGLKVGMTGDGVNDAPALAQADVGIAIGAGTDVAVATADVVLVKSSTLDVVAIVKLSRATYRKMLQNLAWATGYNIVAIPLAAGVAYNAGILLDPALGAALMALSTIIVAFNARFLKLQK